MEGITDILDFIGRTNLFNFIIFATVIAFIIVKIDVKGSIEKARVAIVEYVENSKAIKSKSEDVLVDVKKSVAHIEDEIENILKKADNNAQMVGEKIIEDANLSAKNTKENAKKSIEAKEVLLKNDLIRRASLASIDVAKKQIIHELTINPELHNKLIDESINAIDRKVL